MSKLDSPWRALMLVSMIGVELAISVLLGFWGGRYLDQLWETEPIFLIVGILVGLTVGFFTVIRLIRPFIGD